MYPDNQAGADRVRTDGTGAGAATLLGILGTHSASPSFWAAHTHTHALALPDTELTPHKQII